MTEDGRATPSSGCTRKTSVRRSPSLRKTNMSGKAVREYRPVWTQSRNTASSLCPTGSRFLNIVIFNYLIGNADAHGKNFSLLYDEGKPRLAPAYDLLSTAVYPELAPKMAMKIGGKCDPNDVYLRHWHRLVPDTAGARNALEKNLARMAANTLDQATKLHDELKKENIT